MAVHEAAVEPRSLSSITEPSAPPAVTRRVASGAGITAGAAVVAGALLLTRDQASYKDDLSAARAWLTRYYDTGDKAVASTTATLRTLHESSISIQLPDISATLDALRTYRQPRERTTR